MMFNKARYTHQHIHLNTRLWRHDFILACTTVSFAFDVDTIRSALVSGRHVLFIGIKERGINDGLNDWVDKNKTWEIEVAER
jgi:hypothetical protein